MLRRISIFTVLLAAIVMVPVHAEDPSVLDKVIADLAKVGPDALLARVKELKDKSVALNKEAAGLRTKADQLDAQAATLKAQVDAVEKFTTELAKAMAPPPAPAPTPAAPAATPAPAPAKPAEPAPAKPAAPVPAPEK